MAAPTPVNLAAVSISQEKTWSGTPAWPPGVGHCCGKAVQLDLWPTQERGRQRPNGTPGRRVDQSRRNEWCPGALFSHSPGFSSDARFTHPLHYMKLHGGHLPTPPVTSGACPILGVLSFTFKHHVSLKKKKKSQGVNIEISFPSGFV